MGVMGKLMNNGCTLKWLQKNLVMKTLVVKILVTNGYGCKKLVVNTTVKFLMKITGQFLATQNGMGEIYYWINSWRLW